MSKKKKIKKVRLIKNCLRCNLPLTKDESMKAGYGKICIKKIGIPVERGRPKIGTSWVPKILPGQKRLGDFL